MRTADPAVYRSHTQCVGATTEHPRKHTWYLWAPNTDMGYEKTGMRYTSECQNSGCKARRYVEDLAMRGDYDELFGLAPVAP